MFQKAFAGLAVLFLGIISYGCSEEPLEAGGVVPLSRTNVTPAANSSVTKPNLIDDWENQRYVVFAGASRENVGGI